MFFPASSTPLLKFQYLQNLDSRDVVKLKRVDKLKKEGSKEGLFVVSEKSDKT